MQRILVLFLFIIGCNNINRLVDITIIKQGENRYATISTYMDYTVNEYKDAEGLTHEYRVDCWDNQLTTLLVFLDRQEIWYYHRNLAKDRQLYKFNNLYILIDTIKNSESLNYYQTKKLLEVIETTKATTQPQ